MLNWAGEGLGKGEDRAQGLGINDQQPWGMQEEAAWRKESGADRSASPTLPLPSRSAQALL